MIKVIKVTKRYGKKNVLNKINFDINEKDKIAIMGLNGSGKTTLSEIILKIFKPTKGEVIYESKNIVRNATFQDGSFDNELNLKQLISFYSSAFGIKIDTNDLLKKFQLSDFENRRYIEMSGGQKQKFKFLITLLNNPNLLLLDELTTSLDYLWREKIIKLVKNYIIENDCTLIIVSHNIEEVAELCNRIILLSNGQIIKDFQLSEDKNRNIELIKSEVFNNVGNI